MPAGLKNAYAGAAIQAGYTKIGTYVGDGAATKIIGTPFAPDLVEVWIPDNGAAHFFTIRHKNATQSLTIHQTGATVSVLNTFVTITAMDATSFTVSSADGCNVAGQTYFYRAQQSGVFP